MKRTEKEIYDFIKKKIDESEDELSKIGDGYKYSDRLDTHCRVMEAEIWAYKAVLNFIDTIRSDEK